MDFDFGTAIDDMSKSSKTALTLSALQVHNIDSTKHAANVASAKKQGIHPALATPATHPVSAAEFNDLAATFAGTTGHTATTLSDPTKAAYAKDDVENMTTTERLLGEIPKFAKAVARVAAYTGASIGSVPISGLSALGKLVTSGSIAEATKVLEENQKLYDDYYLTTPEEKQAAANIGLASVPFEMAGKGLAGIAELPTGGLSGATDVIQGRSAGSNFMVPIAYTIGAAAAMYGFGEAGKTRLGEAVNAHFTAVVDAAKKSKFRKLAPDHYSDFVKGAAEEAQHPGVQMPVDVAEKLYGKVTDETPAHIVAAKFAGTKVEVPVHDLTAMAEHVTPEDLTNISVEGVLSAAEIEKSKAAAVKEAPEPVELRPAVKVGGKIKVCEPGQRHTDAVKDAPEEDRGFTLDGKTMLSREEAAAWLKENHPDLHAKLPEDQKTSLHSEGLWDSQEIEVPGRGKEAKSPVEQITEHVPKESLEKHTSDPSQPVAAGFLSNERGSVDLSGIKEAIEKLSDYFTVSPVPMLSRAGAADSVVQHANARIATPHIVEDLLAKAFPDIYKDPVKTSEIMDILNKDNILGGYDTFLKLAAKAAADGDVTEAGKFMQLAEDIAAKHDVNAFDRDVRAASNNPEMVTNTKRWIAHVSPELDKLYNEMKGVDPDMPREGRGRYINARVNLLSEERAAAWKAAMQDSDKPMPEASASSYRNPNAKADSYDRHAHFTGDYSTDATAILANVIGPRWNEVTKVRMFKDLIAKGLAFTKDPGEGYLYSPVKMPKTDSAGVTHMTETPLWLRKDLVKEFRNALNTDQPLTQNKIMKLATSLQLAQIADAATHGKNVLSVITRAQGAGSAWADIVRKMPVLGTADAVARIVSVTKEVSGDSPAIRAEIAEMARQGNIRPEYPPTRFQKITRGQAALHAMDTGARIVMNRFFDDLVHRGLVEDTVEGRREFIGQIGNYNKRLIGPWAKAAMQTGLSPFLTAGRNFNRQGRWAVSGYSGVKAASTNAAVQLRMTNLLGTAALFTLPMMLNMLSTGKVGGRPGTPLGAWDTGGADNHGKHTVVDLLQLTGVRRGMRTLGIDAIAEGLRNGLTHEQILSNALQQVGQAAISPWTGPGAGLVAKTVTGRQLDVQGRMAAQKVPGASPFSPRQLGENFRAALEDQNPMFYAVALPALKKAGIDQKAQTDDAPSEFLRAHLGDYAGTIASKVTKAPLSAAGIKEVKAGRSAAEELTYQYEKQDGMEQGKDVILQAKKEAIDLMRQGTEWSDLPEEVLDKFSRMSSKQRDAIKKEATQTDLQHRFNQLDAVKATEVWKVATDDEREDLGTAYRKKVGEYRKTHEGENLEEFNDAVEAAEERR